MLTPRIFRVVTYVISPHLNESMYMFNHFQKCFILSGWNTVLRYSKSCNKWLFINVRCRFCIWFWTPLVLDFF